METLASLASSAPDDETVLILAGDIGDSYSDPYRRLLLAARAAYRYVLLVPGNHEYYTDGVHDMSVVKEHLGRLCLDTGVTLLDNMDTVIQGIRFVGSTCWPLVPEEQYKVLKREGYGLVTRITKDSHRLDYSDFKRLHDSDVRYLESTVRDSKEPCVVITHYPPTSLMLDDKFEHSSQIALHFNDGLIDKIAKTQGATPLWCCGHCHTAKKFWTRGMNTVLVANCVEGGQYDPDFVFEMRI
jgi:predicted phosphohydrolase